MWDAVRDQGVYSQVALLDGACSMSALPLIATEQQTFGVDGFVPIANLRGGAQPPR
jgi:hypothetical protein